MRPDLVSHAMRPDLVLHTAQCNLTRFKAVDYTTIVSTVSENVWQEWHYDDSIFENGQNKK